MSNPEQLERYGRARAARAFAPSETLKNYLSPLPEPSVSSASDPVYVPSLSFTADDSPSSPKLTVRAYRIRIDEVETTFVVDAPITPSKLIVGTYRVAAHEFEKAQTVEAIISTEGATLRSSLGLEHLPSPYAPTLHDPFAWTRNKKSVLRHAKERVAEDVHLRLEDLFRIEADEEQEPLTTTAAGSFVYYCICRGIRRRPLMTVTPTGELDATWRQKDGQYWIMRFFPDRTVWLAYNVNSIAGSLGAPVERLATKNDPLVNVPHWADV